MCCVFLTRAFGRDYGSSRVCNHLAADSAAGSAVVAQEGSLEVPGGQAREEECSAARLEAETAEAREEVGLVAAEPRESDDGQFGCHAPSA